MVTITTLRPSATQSGVGWVAQPTGALHEVTADDLDTTYALWSGDGSALILAVPSSSPPPGEWRHQVRIRVRGSDGSAWWAVRIPSGQLIAGAAGTFLSIPETFTGSWQSGVSHDGPTTLSCYVVGQNPNVRIIELYLDIDSRLPPSFTPQLIDGSGTPNTTITDTVSPTARVTSLNLDGLPARQYRYWVSDENSSVVWDTGVVSGAPTSRVIPPLQNGNYTLHQQVWSTIGSNTAYPSDIISLPFVMAVGAVPAPDPPIIIPMPPFYSVEACLPDDVTFDDDRGWLEIQRVDCDEPTTIAILGPLAPGECAQWIDFTVPRTLPGDDPCRPGEEPCCSRWRVRSVGLVDESILVSDWSNDDPS